MPALPSLFSRATSSQWNEAHPSHPPIGEEIGLFLGFFLRAAIFFAFAIAFFAALQQVLRFVSWLTGADCQPTNVVSTASNALERGSMREGLKLELWRQLLGPTSS